LNPAFVLGVETSGWRAGHGILREPADGGKAGKL